MAESSLVEKDVMLPASVAYLNAIRDGYIGRDARVPKDKIKSVKFVPPEDRYVSEPPKDCVCATGHHLMTEGGIFPYESRYVRVNFTKRVEIVDKVRVAVFLRRW